MSGARRYTVIDISSVAKENKQNLQLYQVIPKNQQIGIWQFGKIGVLVNFINQKLNSKHLVCLVISAHCAKMKMNEKKIEQVPIPLPKAASSLSEAKKMKKKKLPDGQLR